MIQICRICDVPLNEKDIKFVRNRGPWSYFEVTCSDCGMSYYCNEKGAVVEESKVWSMSA